MEQKKFDINTFIGMILLGGILLYWINTNKPEETPDTSTKTEQVVNTTTNNTISDFFNTIGLIIDFLESSSISFSIYLGFTLFSFLHWNKI